MDKETRKEFYENERKKTEEVALKIQKFTEQQKKCQLGIEKQIKKINKQIEKQTQAEKTEEKYIVFLRDERIKAEREKMKQKKEKREKEHDYLKKVKSESNLYLNSKPLYVKIEEQFKNDIEMPELERRKQELKRKRFLCSPIDVNKIKEHSEWYANIKETNKRKIERQLLDQKIEQKAKEHAIADNAWKSKTLKEEKIKKEESLRKHQQKIQLIEKRNHYADLVQEMFSPILDKNQKIKSPACMENEGKKAKKIIETQEAKSDGEHMEQHKKKKFKPNTMIPPPKVQREPKPIKYLEDRRKERENHKSSTNREDISKLLEGSLVTNSMTPKDIEKAKKNIMKLDQLAKKKSLLIQNNPDIINTLKETESVDSLLIGSIRTKLAILSNLE